ncbi:MAG: hypothetical protein PHE99_04280 [Bacteroidales bacterium]|nr:hypothetical protein [Bacteroidales bacterium]
MKKSIFFLTLSALVIVAIFSLIKTGESKYRPYYSGDAISYNEQVYLASTNSGYLEVFVLEDKNLKPIAKIKNYDARLNKYSEFFDLKFSAENNKLYVYTISAYSLFKYEVKSDNLELVKENKNSYWEWYNRVDRFGSNIVTISAKGIKIWNNDLQVINSYDLSNELTPYNLRANNNRYITNINDDYLEVYDRYSRSVVKEIPLNFFQKPNNHKSYQDSDLNIYAVDDYYAKKFSPEGKLLGSFRHLDHEGFDITSSGNAYVYFSNGMGVVKLLASDMSLKDFAFTHNMADAGGWAMGLNVVNNKGYDNLVIFNSSNILVLDHNLDKLASISASEKEDPYPRETLFLNTSNNTGTKGSFVTISGGGFVMDENLTINFAGAETVSRSDRRGRFEQELVIPDKKGMVDIKVTGQSSKLTYSISFNIIESK